MLPRNDSHLARIASVSVLAVLAALLAVFLAAASVQAADAGWRASTRDGRPAVAALFGPSGELIECDSPGTPSSQIDPSTGEFIPSVRVDDDINPEHREPVVAWGDGGLIHAAYAERAVHWNPELIKYTRSTDGGRTWLAPAVRVNDTAPNAVYFPAIGVLDDGAIVLVWGELKFAPYNSEIRFSRSDDDGATWTLSKVIHPIDPTRDYYRPSILVVGGRIYVAFWYEFAYPNAQALLVYSDDRGETWSTPIVVSGVSFADDTSGPGLAWNESLELLGLIGATNDNRVLFTSSADQGLSWATPVQINDVASTSADSPDLAAMNGRFYAVWCDNRTSQYDCNIWFTSSTDGDIWGPNQRVNDIYTPGNQYEPHLQTDPLGGLHVCWIWNMPFEMNIDCYYTKSTDGGATWLEHSPRVNDVPYIVQPYVAWTTELLADETGAFVFWNDGRATRYYDNIYMSRDIDPTAVHEIALAGGTLSLAAFDQPGPAPRLRLVLARPGSVEVELCDALGRRLGRTAFEMARPGEQSLGLSALTSNVPGSGTYFVRARAGGENRTTRVLVVH